MPQQVGPSVEACKRVGYGTCDCEEDGRSCHLDIEDIRPAVRRLEADLPPAGKKGAVNGEDEDERDEDRGDDAARARVEWFKSEMLSILRTIIHCILSVPEIISAGSHWQGSVAGVSLLFPNMTSDLLGIVAGVGTVAAHALDKVYCVVGMTNHLLSKRPFWKDLSLRERIAVGVLAPPLLLISLLSTLNKTWRTNAEKGRFLQLFWTIYSGTLDIPEYMYSNVLLLVDFLQGRHDRRRDQNLVSRAAEIRHCRMVEVMALSEEDLAKERHLTIVAQTVIVPRAEPDADSTSDEEESPARTEVAPLLLEEPESPSVGPAVRQGRPDPRRSDDYRRRQNLALARTIFCIIIGVPLSVVTYFVKGVSATEGLRAVWDVPVFPEVCATISVLMLAYIELKLPVGFVKYVFDKATIARRSQVDDLLYVFYPALSFFAFSLSLSMGTLAFFSAYNSAAKIFPNRTGPMAQGMFFMYGIHYTLYGTYAGIRSLQYLFSKAVCVFDKPFLERYAAIQAIDDEKHD
mmetsp:Transcript_33420/g.93802  ORF Transcript_33420/g.93802 Transcript_33420/m.93802 type:complete len:518 (+) Transcript_33420:116-1669(+)